MLEPEGLQHGIHASPDELLERLQQAIARADGEVELSAYAAQHGATRFAGSHPIQTIDVETVTVQARVVDGRGAIGAARAAALDEGSIARTIAEAREVALAQPAPRDDAARFPGFDDGRAPHPAVDAWDDQAAQLGPGERADRLAAAFAIARERGLDCAGSIAALAGAQAVATRAGCRRAYRFTTCRLDLGAGDGSASGWAGAYGHRAAQVDAREVARAAVERAEAGRDPQAIEPGAWDVILEPKAVAEALEWLALASLTARALDEGSSCFAGRIGERVTSERVTLVDDAASDDPAALRAPFDAEGTPKLRVALIERGVARGVVCDRASSRHGRRAPTGHAVALADELALESALPHHLALAPGDDTLDDLVARVDRGLLVTRFHYVNGLLDPPRARMTGMTRDGLLRIEGGKIRGGARNLRWTESLLEALDRVGGVTRERRAVPGYWSPMPGGGLLCPTLLIRGFRFDPPA